MNKYPLDARAIQDISRDLVQNDAANREVITTLAQFLVLAMEDATENDIEDSDWYEDANLFLQSLNKRTMDFETHRFNQKNNHFVGKVSPYEDSRPMDLYQEGKLNAMESEFGEELSESDIAQFFKEPVIKTKKKKTKKLEKMSLEEIESWEKQQDNSNDIYKVSARIKNLARQGAGANLTTAGDVLCNSHTHLCKAFYDFAETIQDKDTKIKLIDLVRNNEGMVANVISALSAGVSIKKD